MRWFALFVQGFLCISFSSTVLLWSTAASATVFAFTKIVDTSTPVPGDVGTFNFFPEASFDGTNVAFTASAPSGSGVYI